jgi:hypothetical protein
MNFTLICHSFLSQKDFIRVHPTFWNNKKIVIVCFYLCFVGNRSSPHFSFPFRVFRKNPFLFSFFDFGKKKPFPFFLFRFLKKNSISIPFSFLIFENRDFRNPFLFPFKGFVKGADPRYLLQEYLFTILSEFSTKRVGPGM